MNCIVVGEPIEITGILRKIRRNLVENTKVQRVKKVFFKDQKIFYFSLHAVHCTCMFENFFNDFLVK